MKHAREDYQRFQDPLGKIPADEPVFLIRSQDIVGAETVRFWALVAGAAGASLEIIKAASDQADAMEAWQKANGSKVPDLPESGPPAETVPKCPSCGKPMRKVTRLDIDPNTRQVIGNKRIWICSKNTSASPLLVFGMKPPAAAKPPEPEMTILGFSLAEVREIMRAAETIAEHLNSEGKLSDIIEKARQAMKENLKND